MEQNIKKFNLVSEMESGLMKLFISAYELITELHELKKRSV